jgi:phosphate transport system ATP-binding protein
MNTTTSTTPVPEAEGRSAPAPSPARQNRAVRAVAHGEPVLVAENLDVWFGARQVLEGIDLSFPERSVTALIGPSGCGKSTFIRCLNRMHELVPDARVRGSVRLRDNEIYAGGADPVAIRRSIGMVFQRPNPFPTKSIADNILAGPRFTRTRLSRGARQEAVERALVGAGLWDEVKDRLGAPAGGLSGGQQQRLCIARSLAVEPDVLLMDEPCSALDPQSTFRIEDLIDELKLRLTIVIVTHNMQQAARISDFTAFVTIEREGEPGRLVEHGATRQVFTSPRSERTEAYVMGRFG